MAVNPPPSRSCPGRVSTPGAGNNVPSFSWDLLGETAPQRPGETLRGETSLLGAGCEQSRESCQRKSKAVVWESSYKVKVFPVIYGDKLSSSPRECPPVRAARGGHSGTSPPRVRPCCPRSSPVPPLWMLAAQWCSQVNRHGNREPRQTKSAFEQPAEGFWLPSPLLPSASVAGARCSRNSRDRARKPHPRASRMSYNSPLVAEG